MTDKKFESMLSQLITMVGKMGEELTSVREEQASMREEQANMREEQTSMREKINLLFTENENRHKEIMDRFSLLEADLELTWEKAARNEREIGKFKKLLEL